MRMVNISVNGFAMKNLTEEQLCTVKDIVWHSWNTHRKRIVFLDVSFVLVGDETLEQHKTAYLSLRTEDTNDVFDRLIAIRTNGECYLLNPADLHDKEVSPIDRPELYGPKNAATFKIKNMLDITKEEEEIDELSAAT